MRLARGDVVRRAVRDGDPSGSDLGRVLRRSYGTVVLVLWSDGIARFEEEEALQKSLEPFARLDPHRCGGMPPTLL